MPRSPTFADAIKGAISARLDELRTAMPAQVRSYDPATQTVQVQPLIKIVTRDDDGNELVESLPVVNKVPVAFPRAGAFIFTMPIQVDDIVILIIADRALDRWRTQGGEVDPGDLRTHNLSDAMAIPGIYPTSQAIPAMDISAAGTYLGQQGGPGVHVTTAFVELGGSVATPPVDFVALATRTEARLAALEASMLQASTHIHVGTFAPGPNPVGPPVIITATPSSGPVAATKVKGV